MVLRWGRRGASGFRDSLKGQYYGELGSGFDLIVRGRGLGGVKGEELDHWGWGSYSEEEGRWEEKEKLGETHRPSAPGPVPGK